jgi:hypothetical protein
VEWKWSEVIVLLQFNMILKFYLLFFKRDRTEVVFDFTNEVQSKYYFFDFISIFILFCLQLTFLRLLQIRSHSPRELMGWDE